MKAYSLMLVAVTLCWWGGGCAEEPLDTTPTLASWQTNVEQYVWDHGNGDPTVLADMSWDDVHKGFAVIGNPQPAQSTDMIGLLVAHRMVDGVPYFVFLLADVDRKKLVGLRAIALNVSGGRFYWFVGEENGTSLSRYGEWSRSNRGASGPDDPAPPVFPRPGDVFEVKVAAGSDLQITHQPTGATWSVHLADVSAYSDSGEALVIRPHPNPLPGGEGVNADTHAPTAARPAPSPAGRNTPSPR